MARLGRGRREGARISRAQSSPTPTPLIRRRLVQTPVANDRASLIARVWRRHRAHIILRAPMPALPLGRQPQPLASRAGWRASIRGRVFQPRGARITRGVSTPTATPLIRKRLVQAPNGNERAAVRARWFKKRARVVTRSNPTPLVPALRPRMPLVVGRNRRPARIRSTARRHAFIVRAPQTTPSVVRPRVIIVTDARRAAVKARLRHRTRIVRSFVAPFRPCPVLTASPAARRAGRIRFAQHHRARVVVTRVVTQPQPRQKQPLIVRNRRAVSTRTFFARRRVHLETSTLGIAAPPGAIVVGFFDGPAPRGGTDVGTPSANVFGTPAPGGGADGGTPSGNNFDSPTPGQVRT